MTDLRIEEPPCLHDNKLYYRETDATLHCLDCGYWMQLDQNGTVTNEGSSCDG